MSLDTRRAWVPTSAFNQWAPSYARATWLIGSLLIGAVVPFTFGVIMRTNHALLAPGGDVSSAQTRELLEHWGQLLAVRSVPSVASTILFLWLIIGI